MGNARMFVMVAGSAIAFSGAAAMAQQSADEVRAMVAETLADAESRSSLLAGGDAGHDTKFFVAGDGFRLNINGLTQLRYVADIRNTSGVGSTGDDFTHGFQIARTMVDFNGELDKDWFFRIRAAQYGYRTNNSSTSFGNFGNTALGFDYMYFGYKFSNGWKITAGQFKTPLIREELVSELNQIGVDRSIVNSTFSGTFTEGVMATYEASNWRAFFSLNDGLNTAQTDFNGPNEAVSGIAKVKNEAEYAITARGEYIIKGDFKKFEDFTSPRGADFACMLGAAVNWQQSPNTNNAADVDSDTLRYTVDCSLKGDGWNAYAAFCGDHTTQRVAGNDNPDQDTFGAIVQGGFRITEDTEIYAQWTAIFADADVIRSVSGATGSSTKNFNFATLGVTHFFAGHALQAQIEALYSFQNTANMVALGNLPNTGPAILGETKAGEVMLRLQFNIAF